MEIMIFCGIYLVELVCYLIVMRMLFDKRVKTKAWMIAGGLLPLVVEALHVKASGKNALITICVLGVMFLSLEGKAVEKGVLLVLALLLLECVDSVLVLPYERLLTFLHISYFRNFKYLAVKCCTAVCALFLSFIKDVVFQYKKIHINSIVYFVIGIIAFSMLFCLDILNQVKIYIPKNNFIIICKILNISIVVSILLLVLFVVYIKNTHDRLEQLLRTERLLKESQVNYYKQLLRKETDTRKYRHDMVNHLVYIHDILNRGKIKDAQNYISNMLGGFENIQNTYYMAGNEMVDIIMNYFFGMLSKDVKIIVLGKCPVVIDIQDIDICTIFSNIFQNAVEEILENNIKNAYIAVYVHKGNHYVEYDIKNSLYKQINENYVDKNGFPKSHKNDKHNHGIGMLNVKKTIEKNRGKFKWYQNKDSFCVNVVLPIK